MLAARCPDCGASCPVSVHEVETLRCAHCGHVGPHDDGVRLGLQKAAGVLEALDAQQRQLGERQRQRVARAWISDLAALVILLTIFLPAFFLGLTMAVGMVVVLWLESGVVGLFFGLMVAVGAIAIPGSAFLVYGIFRRQLNKLLAACAAVPPGVAGQPARCRVCGAGLPAGGPERMAVVRCEYCAADNLVDPGTLQKLGAKQVAVLEEYDRELERTATALTQDPGAAPYLVGLIPVGLAVVAGVCLGALMVIALAAP